LINEAGDLIRWKETDHQRIAVLKIRVWSLDLPHGNADEAMENQGNP
jgi:hypothetical protein